MSKTYTTAGMLGVLALAMLANGCTTYTVGDQNHWIESLARTDPHRIDAAPLAEMRLPPAPSDRVNIAVSELRSLALSAAEVATLSERLRDTLSETGFFNVLSSADMETVLKPLASHSRKRRGKPEGRRKLWKVADRGGDCLYTGA